VIGLIAQGGDIDSIVRGLHRSLIRRVSALARGAGVQPPLMLSGGVARSGAIRELLAQELKSEVIVPPEPQLMGAYGAALIALEA
jgi:activator of 2-hydroxyglutaryl-CoA dehydratase